ncbi:MAG: helix-turn-helix transcriptional regulator [Chloroflexi bacterium]|nr:helix-turn-helix transcriptional regulator [Chloroflexota bacterium]MBV9602999.1 helix-turn-helix transcriptional regulator [Chloroflexota bacterium]
MSYPMPSPRETAIDNWNHAVQTYRASVDLYTRAVKIRQRRQCRRLPRVPSAAAAVEFAPAPPPILDDLTPRERDVALLIARGFSNRKIAHDLVITQGTAANHVAHIIEKLGLANRTQIAAAVVADTNTLDLLSHFEPMPSVNHPTATTNANRPYCSSADLTRDGQDQRCGACGITAAVFEDGAHEPRSDWSSAERG